MRDDLRRTCSDIWVIDCCPKATSRMCRPASFRAFSSQSASCWRRESSERTRGRRRMCVFARCRRASGRKSSPRSRRFARREGWIDCLADWRAPFLAELGGKWADFAPLHDLFIYNGLGTMPGRTWIIAADEETLRKRWERLGQRERREKREELFHPHESGNKTSTKPSKMGPIGHEFRSHSVASDKATRISPTGTRFGASIGRGSPDNRLINRPNPRFSALRETPDAAPASGEGSRPSWRQPRTDPFESLHPLDGGSLANPKPSRSRCPAHSSPNHRLSHPVAQILRMRRSHSCWPPPSQQVEIKI